MAYPNEQNIGDDELPNSISGWIKYIDKKLTPSEKPPTTSLYGLAKGLPPDEEGRKIEQQTLKEMEEFGKAPTKYVEGIKKEIKEQPKETLAKGAGYSALTGLGKAAVAGEIGTAVTGMATPVMGPFAVIPGLVAGGAAYYGLGKGQEAIEPESIQKLRAEVPYTMGTGETVGAFAQPFIKVPKFTPRGVPPTPSAVSGKPTLKEPFLPTGEAGVEVSAFPSKATTEATKLIQGAEGVYKPPTLLDIFKQKTSERLSRMAGRAYSTPFDEALGMAKDSVELGIKSFDEFANLARKTNPTISEELLRSAFTQTMARGLETPKPKVPIVEEKKQQIKEMLSNERSNGIVDGIRFLETGDDSLKPPIIQENKLLEKIAIETDPVIKQQLIKKLLLHRERKTGFEIGSNPKRQRGVPLIQRRLAEAVQQGKISPEAEDMARWLLNQNSSLFDDLAFSIRKQNPIESDNYISGFFDDTRRLATVLTDKNTTPIHEITHYIERYIPQEGRNAIKDAWLNRINTIEKKYKDNTDVQKYISLIKNGADEDSILKEFGKLVKQFPKGVEEFYQLQNPQEFLAVNGTKIFEDRYKSQKDPKFTKEMYERIVQWIKEFYEKIKDVFGFDSNAPIMRQLDKVLKSDSTQIKSRPINSTNDLMYDIKTPKPGEVVPTQPPSTELPSTVSPTEPPATPPSVTPPSEPPKKPQRPEDIQPTWTLGERSKMDVANVNLGDDAEIFGRINRKVFGDNLPPENQDMKLAFEQNRQKLNATKENTERTLAQGIYQQATDLGLVKPGQSFNSFADEFNEFLHYNHATARNARNAQILNEKGEPVTTSGSGLTNEEVSEYFGSRLDPQKREAFQSIYDQQIKPILKGELNDLKNAGKIDDATFSNLNSYIDQGNYVPLIRDFSDMPDYAKPLVGKGRGKGAKITASKGSELGVDNPLANILIKSNRAAETLAKEETKRTAYRFFVNNPNPEVAITIDPTSRAETARRLSSMGLDESQTKNILDGIYGSDVEYVYINPETNKPYGKEEIAQIKKNDPELFESLDKEKRLVYEREKLNGYDNVVPVNIDGKNSYIVFNPKAPDEQGLEIAQLLNGKTEQYRENILFKFSGLVNNYLSALYTKYTPAFAWRNLPRDWMGAAVQINKTPLVGRYGEVTGNATASIPTIASESYKLLKLGKLEPDPNNPTSVLFNQFVKDGGFLSYTKMLQDSQSTSKDLIDKLNKISKSDTKLGTYITGGSYNPLTWLYESIIGPMNNVSELSLRFGAYKTALENGLSRDQAAQISRDISLNLARSGKWIKNELKGLELFAGPRIAGAKQFAGFTTKGGQKLLIDLILLGTLQQALFDQWGESENEQLNRLSSNGNFVIPTGHDDDGNVNFVKFPIGEIFDVPMQFGRSGYKGTQNVRNEKQTLLTAFWNQTGAVSKKVYGSIPLAPSLDFFGVKGAGTFGPVPSAFEPFVNALMNRDVFTGLPISPKVYDSTIPGFQRSGLKSTLTANVISEAINNLTGGTRNTAGMLSPTADQIDYVVRGYAGPFYSVPKQITEALPSTREVTIPRTEIVIKNPFARYVVKNEQTENDWRKLPIVNIFVGKTNYEKEEEIKYYNNLERFNIHLNELGAERRNEKSDMKAYISDYVSRNPDAKIADPDSNYGITNDLKDAVQEITESNRKIRNIVKSEKYKEDPDRYANEIEKLNLTIYKNQGKFNRLYEKHLSKFGPQ